MPRVTAEYRDARREAIAAAAVRAWSRNGIAGTGMADIISEAGSSAGSVYANFRNKAELAAYVAAKVLDPRTAGLLRRAEASATPMAPAEVLLVVLEWLADGSVPVELVVQFWGEATTDPGIRDVVRTTIADLEDVLARALHRWAESRSAGAPEAAALRTASAAGLATAAQGYIARIAVIGPLDPRAYLGALGLH